MRKSRTLSAKPRNRSVLATRRRAMRKQSSSNLTHRNSAFRMSLLKEDDDSQHSQVLWPLPEKSQSQS